MTHVHFILRLARNNAINVQSEVPSKVKVMYVIYIKHVTSKQRQTTDVATCCILMTYKTQNLLNAL